MYSAQTASSARVARPMCVYLSRLLYVYAICMSTHIYIYIYTYIMSLSLYIYIYTHTYIYMYGCDHARLPAHTRLRHICTRTSLRAQV